MKATKLLHDMGQSLWLDNVTRDLLDSGTLRRYIDELSVTGLTSNPTIFDHTIKNSSAYDVAIRAELAKGKSGEELFFDLALEDITRAADLFRPIWERTASVDGWVSLEVSPLLAYEGARCPAHREHDAGENAERLGYPHGTGPAHGDRWWRLRARPREFRQRGDRHRCPCRPSAGRRREGVRGVVELAHGGHRLEECRAEVKVRKGFSMKASVKVLAVDIEGKQM